MVKLTIDNQVIEAKEGSTILEAAEALGIFIPTLCHHEALTPTGSCRVCSVEVIHNNKSDITTACDYPVEEGMKVITNSEKVINLRKMVVELLLAQWPHFPEIQALARQLGITQPRFAIEMQDCILCQMCVKACHEVVDVNAISFITRDVNHQGEAYIDVSPDKCIGCGSCAYVCPTGAIKLEDVGDTRIITWPNNKIEFKLKKCKKCGYYWAPEKQLDYIANQLGLPPEMFDTCPNCRD